MELFDDDDDFLIESSLECLLLSHCPSKASSETASASSLSSSLAPPASSSDSLEKRRRHEEDADRVEFVSNTRLSNKDANNSTSAASSILEKAIASITQQDDEEEKEEEIPHLDLFQKRAPFKSTSDISHQLSNSLTQKTCDRNQILVEEDREVEHLQDSSSICDFSDFEDFLFLDFSCLEDESSIYLDSRLVASISPPSIVKISDKLEEEINEDLDSMAALFAFNASCTSPSCRSVHRRSLYSRGFHVLFFSDLLPF